MTYLEFLGVPGAGKSTLRLRLDQFLRESATNAVLFEESVLEAIRADGSDRLARSVARVVRNARGRIWRRTFARSTDRFQGLVRAIGQNRDLMHLLLRWQAARDGRDLEPEVVLGRMLSFLAQAEIALGGVDGSSWVLIDEGFCHRAVSLFAYRFSEDDTGLLEDYVNLIPVPPVTVFVETPIELCVSRLDAVGWPDRIMHEPVGDRLAFIENARHCVDMVADVIARRGSLVIRVDGSEPVEVSVKKVAAVLDA